MQIITDKITKTALRDMVPESFGNLVKAVVDVKREILAVDAEMHSDLEALLLDDGSRQQDLWGINLYPEEPDPNFIEYDSMINVRPSQGNRSRSVDSAEIRKRIEDIVSRWVAP